MTAAYDQPLGIIGVGHLADFLVRGMRKSDARRIFLGPRNAQRTEQLARELACVACTSNQAVADAAATVVIATPPAQCIEAVAAVRWSAQHTIISMVAGVGHAAVQAAAGPATVVRAIPAPASAEGVDTIPMFPPSEAVSNGLAALGRVIPIKSEAAFKVLATVGLCQLWSYGLIEALAAEVQRAGIEPPLARRFVAEHLRSAAELALALPADKAIGGVLEQEARPGTLTAAGLAVLRTRGAFPAWQEAFAKALPMSSGAHL